MGHVKTIPNLKLITTILCVVAQSSLAEVPNTQPRLTSIETFQRSTFDHALLNTEFVIAFDDLRLRSDLWDEETDDVIFVISSITAGQLTIDGAPVVAGQTVFGPSNILVWTSDRVGLPVPAFTVKGFDGLDTSLAAIPVLIDVIDPQPRFTKGADQSVSRMADPQVIFDWARNIGPEESALFFEVTNDNPALFMTQPEIQADGTLVYSINWLNFGTANVTAVLVDTDGRRSAPQTFRITVQHVNFPPTFQLQSSVTVAEDSGSQAIANFLTEVTAGYNEPWQTVSWTVTPGNADLYAVRPCIDVNGTLRFKAAANASGTDTVRVTVRDNGTTTGGGWNQSTRTFELNITPVNDAPTVSIPSVILTEDVRTNVDLTLVDMDGGSGSTAEVASFDAALIESASVSLIGSRGVLSITPAPNANGRTFLTLRCGDGEAQAEYNVSITINPVNDAPGFTLKSESVPTTYAGVVNTIRGFAGNTVAGPANEASQAVVFEVTTTTIGFFSTKPVIAADGTLLFKVAENATGSADLTVVARDNGGTVNGGVNASARQAFQITTSSNPFPAAVGVYAGLFFETNEVQHASSGLLTMKLKSRGFYSGKVMIDGATHGFAGQFTLQGGMSASIPRGSNKTTLVIAVQLDGDELSGSVSDGTWTAALAADKAAFNAVFNPTPLAGQYTVVLPKAATGPSGFSVASVAINASGNVQTVLNLADGTVGRQTVRLSKRGQWPLYVSLYGGRGSVLGWMNATTAGTTGAAGSVSWINTGEASAFAVEAEAIGSRYIQGPSVPSAQILVLRDALLASGLELPVNVLNNTITSTGAPTLVLSIKPRTGLIQGRFIHPVTGLTVPVKAALLQQQGELAGFMMTAAGSGEVVTKK
jgi:hypothetical protein